MTQNAILAAIQTESTCGEACWSARDDVCRCSCGGRNHGVLRGSDSSRPDRTSKIAGYVYRLEAVGKYSEIWRQAYDLCLLAPKRQHHGYSYSWWPTEDGAPARCQSAGKGRIARWPELTAYRNDRVLAYNTYLLWVRTN